MEQESRHEFVEALGDYINEAKDSIESLINNLGWSKEVLQNDLAVDKVCCPFNPGHLMTQTSLENHQEICAWKNEGYSREEIENALKSSHFFYQHSTSVVPVLIDKTMQNKILSDAAAAEDSNEYQTFESAERNVPRTMDRAITEFTPKERLAIYEFVIEKMKQIKKESLVKYEDLQCPLEARKDSGDGKPKSKLELIAENRDYKRRRQSYRAKNVHITKKSYTEIMREVIQNQMEMFSENSFEDDDLKTQIKSDDSDTKSKSKDKSRSSNKQYYEESSTSKCSYDYNERFNKHSFDYAQERASRKRSLDYEEEKSTYKRSFEYEDKRSSRKRVVHEDERRYESSRHRKHERNKSEDEYSERRHHKRHKHKKSKHK